MKIAIYTLTRDRLEYTKHCFKTLKNKAGYEYDHFVLDNGSSDGTQDWLVENESMFKKIVLCDSNLGISDGSNTILDIIYETDDYDLIIKMDNDCEVISDNILIDIVNVFSSKKTNNWVLSPRVTGIINQPKRGYKANINNYEIGLTSIVGGLFHIVKAETYKKYKYPIELPKAWGQDDHFCDWLHKNHGITGYIEDIIVNHYETTNGQAERFPDYFKRKKIEEKNG